MASSYVLDVVMRLPPLLLVSVLPPPCFGLSILSIPPPLSGLMCSTLSSRSLEQLFCHSEFSSLVSHC